MTDLPKDFMNAKRPQLFDGLTESSVQKLLACSIIQEYEASRILVQQGDFPEGIYLVLEGTLKTLRLNEEGEEATIRMLQPGDTCMEAVLFMGSPSPISVEAMTKCKLLIIQEKFVKRHVMTDVRFAVNILRIVTRHYKNAIHQIDAMQLKTPLQRIGYYFLLKHLEAGHENLEFALPFKKQAIANYLGITPETFSRALKQIRGLGINVSDDTIRMKDAYALCHFCDADTAALCSKHTDDCADCPLH